MQNPSLASDYGALGINTYIGLWEGPTEDQLAMLRKAGMRVFCEMNETGRRHLDDPTIAGWMHSDEPDNAQPRPEGGWGEAIPTKRIIDEYQRWRDEDPTRPVLINLGQQVANDEWYGRGCEITAYPEYVKGADIVSYDIYPIAGVDEGGVERVWLVAKGLDRLARWSRGEKVIWNALECGQISRPGHKPTPEQLRSEVWMSIIHGSTGIIYFVHQFEPDFDEAALLANPEMSATVKATNQEILDLAPVLNSPTAEDAAVVSSSDPLVPIDLMAKQYGGATYVFAVGMRNLETNGRFRIPGVRNGTVEVLGESRALQMDGREFQDAFGPYGVHIYKVSPPTGK
jgi:hypothetical protein